MKNIDETITTVFDRMENYKAAQKRKQKIAAANATAINSFIIRRLLLCLLLVLGWELELGHTCRNKHIKPRESLLDI